MPDNVVLFADAPALIIWSSAHDTNIRNALVTQTQHNAVKPNQTCTISKSTPVQMNSAVAEASSIQIVDTVTTTRPHFRTFTVSSSTLIRTATSKSQINIA